MKYDIAILGARVIDPETGTDSVLNIGVRDGIISELTPNGIDGQTVIPAQGLCAAPGFIDLHVHEDAKRPGAQFKIPYEVTACGASMGNTTVLGGNCGHSEYPMGLYLKEIKKANLPINYFSQVGNNTLRAELGLTRYDSASKEQVPVLKKMALTAIREGAKAISLGIQYDPGVCTEEIVAMCEAAAETNTFVSVHMRYDTPNKALLGVTEMIDAAKKTGASVQISHLAANVYGGPHNIEKVKEMIERSGCDITCDVYPYDAWATGIKSAVFDNGFDDFNFGVTDLEILTGPYAGQYCTEELFAALRKAEEDTSVACHNAIPEEDIERAYALPFVCVGSDSGITKTEEGHYKGHPRAAGTAPRFLSRYVRDRKVVSLMEGVRKLTLIPAQRLKMDKKGRLSPGSDADITLFNFETLKDHATFGIDVCALPPTGIEAVICGGRLISIRKG